MSRIRIIMLSLLAVFAVGAVASGSALAVTSAPCYQVAEVGTGTFSDAHCLAAGGSKEYVKVKALVTKLKEGEWCAQVTTAATGNYEDNACTKKVAGKEFIKVKGAGISCLQRSSRRRNGTTNQI